MQKNYSLNFLNPDPMKTIKLITLFLFVIILTLLAACIGSSSDKNTSKKKSDSAEIAGLYYFHGKNRCKTCIAVGNISKTTVEKYFKGNPTVAFHEIDVSADSNKALADEFQVASSGLALKYREKGSVYRDELTEFAFMYALSNPDTLEAVLKSKIETVLKNNIAK
jgi:hypothetical protein